MSDVIYRMLAVADAAIYREVRLRACKEEPGSFLESYEEVLERSAEQYFDHSWIAGAFIGRELKGIAGLVRDKGIKVRHKGTVWGVYVAPESRGQGISRRLIEMVLEEGKKAGVEHALITTNHQNALTVNLYKSLGFEPWGINRHMMKLDDGSYIDDLVLTKFLV